MNKRSTLYAKPSFLRGMASVFDIGATLTVYNVSDTPEEADSEAIFSDWATVGNDIYYALEEWEDERDKQAKSKQSS